MFGQIQHELQLQYNINKVLEFCDNSRKSLLLMIIVVEPRVATASGGWGLMRDTVSDSVPSITASSAILIVLLYCWGPP